LITNNFKRGSLCQLGCS